MDSDFEFAEDVTTDFRIEDFDGWGFDGAKKGINGNASKRIVDVDEIVRRRRDDKGEVADDTSNNGLPEEIKFDDDDDQDDRARPE